MLYYVLLFSVWTLDIFKFSLRKLDNNQLKPRGTYRIFKLPHNGYSVQDGGAVVFLTPDWGAIADECHEQLSITYAPGYRYTLDFNNQLFKNASIFDMKDNRGQQINNAEAIQSAPRVWPAFGL